MKKNTIKAFTLVEMLIVIVIIGILIASLMPRMQSAQWRARDVARKNDLAQIQTAIITSQQDKWKWPGMSGNLAKSGMAISGIYDDLINAWMSSVPTDPNGDNQNFWLWSKNTKDNAVVWEYLYMVADRNWVTNGGFILMAKTEVEWWSNWVVCKSGTWWVIASDKDLKTITTCSSFQKGADGATTCEWAPDSEGVCKYDDTSELRYILLY